MRQPQLLLLNLSLAAMLCAVARAQPTPPVQPKLQEVELPPAIVLPPPAETPAELVEPLTAAEAAAIALRKQPTVAVAQAGVAAAQARQQQAEAALKTTLGLGATVTASDVNGANGGSTGAPPDFQFSATVRQLLYDFEHTRDLVRQARSQVDVASAELTVVQADLVLRVKQEFYDLVQAVRLVGVAESNVRNQQQHLALAQARLQSGLGLPYDVVRAQTAYADAAYGLTVARNQAAQARVTLAKTMGIDPRTPLRVEACDEPVPPSEQVPQLVEQAQNCRPEIIQAQAAIRTGQFALSAARTANSPAVVGSVGVQRRGDEFFPDTNIMSAAVGVVWNPFDAGLTKGRVREAEANLQALNAQLDRVRLQVSGEVSQAYLDLKTAEQRLTTAATQVLNAQEALRLAEGRYRAGLGTFIDVLDAQSALEAADTNQVNARSALDRARARLEHAVGANLQPLAQAAGD